MKQLKRKIPRLLLLDDNDYSNLPNIPEFKKLLMGATFDAIKEGVNKNKKSVNLVEIVNVKKYVNINKEDWKTSLNEVMNYFSSIEDYNKAIECRELLKNIK